jgi:hypothetical protein
VGTLERATFPGGGLSRDRAGDPIVSAIRRTAIEGSSTPRPADAAFTTRERYFLEASVSDFIRSARSARSGPAAGIDRNRHIAHERFRRQRVYLVKVSPNCAGEQDEPGLDERQPHRPPQFGKLIFREFPKREQAGSG